MAKLWAVVKREYTEGVRNKWFVISTLFVPIVMAALFVVPALLAARSRADDSVAQVVVLDATGTDLGTRVAAALLADSATPRAPDAEVARHVRVVAPAALPAAESLATRDVMAKRYAGYLVLDSATLAGHQARYAGQNATSIPDMEKVQSLVRQQLLVHRLAGAGMDARRVDSLSQFHLAMPAERITERGRGGSGIAAVIVGYGLAFLMYLSIMLYGQNVMRGVMEEKTTRVAEVVVSSVKPETLLSGKILGVGGIGLTQQLFWLFSGAYITSFLAPFVQHLGSARGAAPAAPFVFPDVSLGAIAAIVSFFVLGVAFYCALYAAIGSTVNSEQEARQAAMPVVFLIVPAFVLAQPVLLNPTSTLAQVLSWLPFTAPIITPMRMMVVPLSPFELAGSLLSVALGTALVVWVAARIYRVGLLMYGKRPSLGEMMRWVAEST